MIDSFVLLTPILMLVFVAVFCFAGCQIVFPLRDPEPKAGPAPTNLIGVAGNNKVALSWDVYPDAVKFSVKRGEISGSYDVTVTLDAPPADPKPHRFVALGPAVHDGSRGSTTHTGFEK